MSDVQPRGQSDTPAAPTDQAQEALTLAAAQMISVDARRVVLIGTAAFALTALTLALLWAVLGVAEHRVWLLTCLVGAGLGLVSLPLVDRHQRQGRLG